MFSYTDPSQNFIERYPQPLDALFKPRTVAVIGAKDTPGSVGCTIMQNLTTSLFPGKIYPVNPKRATVLNLPSFPSIAAIPEQIDLAIIVVPASHVVQVISECVASNVKTAIIISAGFKELGASGQQLENDIVSLARAGNMPIIGPNCLGVMNPIFGLNATFARGMALSGHIAFISQSGAMCTAVLDWSLREKVGFSAFISIGSMADVHWGTLIDYLGSDPNTHSLLLYMETVGDARAFMTAAREVALEKPIIVIKAGRSQAAAQAASSHTGSLTGSDEVFDAALERIGVLRVNSIFELFSMAYVLDKQPIPKGPRLTIVTNAGGPAVLATDAAIQHEAELTTLSPNIIKDLNQFLPEAWSHSNPIDILGDATDSRYLQTLQILLTDNDSDGLLVILSPQDMTQPTATAQKMQELVKNHDKPLLASWMGGDTVREGFQILSHAGIPVFAYPDDAAIIFAHMWRYSQNIQTLYELPEILTSPKLPHTRYLNSEIGHAHQLIQLAQEEGRTLLNEAESKQLLADYHIPVVQTLIAYHADEAVSMAQQLGFPVVLKLFSKTITHKSDVGGVKLNLNNLHEVVSAFEDIKSRISEMVGSEHFEGVTVQRMIIQQSGYELILGCSSDPQFGPVLMFGSGGQLVEVFKDRALALPPLNSNLAHQLIRKTKIYEALKGVRGRKAINMQRLEDIIINFSQMIVEHPRIKECDINPLLASEDDIIALDARVLLHDASISDKQLPKLAIRPYSAEYILPIRLSNGVDIILRPIRPEDEPLMRQFHHELSENSVRQRFFDFISLDQRVTHERLVRICFNDYDREWAIVAEHTMDKKCIVGIGRLSRVPNTQYAQLKLIIVDEYHNLRLGTQLMQHLLRIARNEKIAVVNAHILAGNAGMLKICQNLGFVLHAEEDQNLVHAQYFMQLNS